MTACLSILAAFAVLHVLEVPGQQHKVLMFPEEEPERKLKNLSSKPGLMSVKFRIWRMNLRREVSLCASRPVEAMIWSNRIESPASVAELKTSNTIIREKVANKLSGSLDFNIASGLKKNINGEVKRRVCIQDEAAQKEKRCLTERQVAQVMSRSATQTNPSWTPMRF